MNGSALYSEKPNTKWYWNLLETQDKFQPFGTKLIELELFQNDNDVCLHINCDTRDNNFPVRKANANLLLPFLGQCSNHRRLRPREGIQLSVAGGVLTSLIFSRALLSQTRHQIQLYLKVCTN